MKEALEVSSSSTPSNDIQLPREHSPNKHIGRVAR